MVVTAIFGGSAINSCFRLHTSSKMFSRFIFVLLLAFVINITAQPPIKRFEYKFSFKPPYLAQRDGSIPFWEYGGNAIASSENVRLAPSLKSQKGGVWAKQPANFQWWEVDIMFRVTGRGRVGADGLAFWYTQSKGAYNGNVFGSSDNWNGLGIILDSFDNDNKHNNPYIMGVINDGSKSFDHQNDGSTQMLSGCLRDFRNKPFPTRVKIEYYQNTLTVFFHNGMTNNDADYEMCFRSDGVILPANGHFGVTAATGGLADDHDVIHFLTSSLHVPGAGQTQTQINQEEQQKLSKEYQDYQKKLDQQKEDYRKEHPDEQKEKEGEFDDWFESDSQRELRQIFQGQSSIFEIVKDLHKKVDEVIGKQVNSLNMLSSVYQMQQSQGGVPQQGHPQQGQIPQIGALPIQRHEVESILATQNVFIATLGELKNYIIDLSRKSDSIIQTQARAPTAQVQSVGYDSHASFNELKDSINSVKQNIASIGQRMGSAQHQTSCPEANCLTAGLLALFLSAHLLVMFLYSLYNAKKESQSKKFY